MVTMYCVVRIATWNVVACDGGYRKQQLQCYGPFATKAEAESRLQEDHEEPAVVTWKGKKATVPHAWHVSYEIAECVTG